MERLRYGSRPPQTVFASRIDDSIGKRGIPRALLHGIHAPLVSVDAGSPSLVLGPNAAAEGSLRSSRPHGPGIANKPDCKHPARARCAARALVHCPRTALTWRDIPAGSRLPSRGTTGSFAAA